jgi:hypothetical protein
VERDIDRGVKLLRRTTHTVTLHDLYDWAQGLQLMHQNSFVFPWYAIVIRFILPFSLGQRRIRGAPFARFDAAKATSAKSTQKCEVYRHVRSQEATTLAVINAACNLGME